MKCASCGRESEYSICGSCLAERVDVIFSPPVIEVIRCSRCGDFKLDRWVHTTLEEALEHHLFRSLSVHEEFQVDDIHFEPVGDEIGRYRLYISGMLRDHHLTHESTFEVRLRRIACEKCSRQAGGYYEAILQIRADRRKLKDEEIERITEIVENAVLRERNNPKAFISKIDVKKEGIDIYLGDRNLGQKLSRIISREMGAETKESSKIAGREDGRDFYRFTYLVRLPRFFKGDLVEDGGVIAVVKDNVRKTGYNVMTGKQIRLKNPTLIARREELKESSILNVDATTVEILDPITFETVIAEKPELRIEVGDTVYVARHNDKVIAIHPALLE